MRLHSLAILILILVWGISLTLTNSQTAATTIINSISIPKILNYNVKLLNTTTIGNRTITTIFNYTLNYQVYKSNDEIVFINITGNFTNGTLKLGKIIYLKEGQYQINVVYEPMSIYYPYMIPNLIYNTSYGMITPNETIALIYKGKSFEIINNINMTIYNYSVDLNGYSLEVSILPNGILYYIKNGSLILTLNSYLETLNITFNNSIGRQYFNYINKPYLYAVFNYSSLANSTIPEGYLEFNYPIIFSNGFLVTQVTQIQIRAGQQLALPSLLLGKSVNYVLYINTPENEPITFISNVGTNNITWNKNEYILIGKTQVSTIAGIFNAYEYEHLITPNRSEELLFFNINGTLVKEESVELTNTSPIILFSLNFVGNIYMNPFEQYPNVFNYSNTTLPYKVISPNLSLTISIIITIIIVAILVIVHKRE
ncbi:hypothetical protein [Saccharolobus caldissimus]|uniref:Thermopsin n=1 Tax=Saccharolobus caldissimus TaxID=1702097 RepID=A0AAQ4CT51_9CREN|nr:hypothetical protein [Saccharolobus caldissimus]BDB98982.1 hypothetical protein SACC_19990 [Saccharolobus caldissimus]